MKVLVTGANGLLGSALIHALSDAGHDVRVLVRDPDKLRGTVPELMDDLEIVTGDVTEPDVWSQAVPGVDGVIHAAAFFREYFEPGADTSRLHDTNVTAVSSLISAAEKYSVPVVVHISSTTVLAPGSVAHPAGRGSDPQSDRTNLYRASKVDAEAAVRKYVAGGGTVRVPMILPSWMWGPFDTAPTPAGRLYTSIVRREIPAIPQVGDQVVDSRDVAIGVVRALDRGVSGERYVLAGRWIPLPQIAHLIAAAEGVRAPRTIPTALAMVLAGVIERVARLRGVTPVTTRKAVKALLDGHRSRIESTESQHELEVDFRPMEETIADTARWRRSAAAASPAAPMETAT